LLNFIALIDDDADIAQLYYEFLKTIEGVTVFKFTDPVIALEHIISNKDLYIVILSDLRMPALSGLELIKKIKKTNNDIRTILMTAFEISDDMFKDYVKKEIINGFIQKPIRMGDLCKEVSYQIHAYQMKNPIKAKSLT
jgi:DNA-binding NtrC family response regulator